MYHDCMLSRSRLISCPLLMLLNMSRQLGFDFSMADNGTDVFLEDAADASLVEFWDTCSWFLFGTEIAAGVVGALVNLVCLISLWPRRHSTPAASGLFGMAGSDFVFLVFLVVFALRVPKGMPVWFGAAFCKSVVYVTHVTSAFSVWCWAVLSLQRYTAVTAPYRYHRSNFCQNPVHPLFLTLLMCLLLEMWLPICVIYVPESNECDLDLDWQNYLNIMEVVWSYFLPFGLIVGLESRILLCVKTEYSAPIAEMRKSVSRQRMERSHRRHLRQLQRIFLLAVVDLFLNLPSFLSRIIATLQPMLLMSSKVGILFQTVSHTLYYCLYGINGLYLWLLVFRPHAPSSANNSTSISLSTAYRPRSASESIHRVSTISEKRGSVDDLLSTSSRVRGELQQSTKTHNKRCTWEQ